MPLQIQSREDHWNILALIRFLLALWILIAHSHNFSTHHPVPLFDLSGLGAVYCFLAISGFSIHASFASQPHAFFYRRFCRIAPVHLVALALTVLVYCLLPKGNPNPAPTVWQWIGCLFLLQAVVPVAIPVIFPAWSLSIEFAYYTMTPWLARTPYRYLAGLTLMAAAFCVVRTHFFSGYLGTDTYGLSIFLMLWAYLAGWLAFSHYKTYWCFPLMALVGFACLLGDLRHKPGTLLIPTQNEVAMLDSLIWCGVAAALCFLLKARLWAWAGAFFNYLGELSYPLYLTHYPVMFLLANCVVPIFPQIDEPLFFMACALVISALVHHLVEIPARIVLKKWRLAS